MPVCGDQDQHLPVQVSKYDIDNDDGHHVDECDISLLPQLLLLILPLQMNVIKIVAIN